MPLILLLALLPLVVIALTPWLLFQRYRAGSMRRPARRWTVVLAMISTALSAVFLLIGAAMTNIWVANAFGDAALGLVIGCVLGLVGLMATRWEATIRTFHYTPNRMLVLFVTLVVTARVVFGIYRMYVAGQAGLTGTNVVGAFGVAESLAAGALVIGYYLSYNAGVFWKIRRWERRPLKPA